MVLTTRLLMLMPASKFISRFKTQRQADMPRQLTSQQRKLLEMQQQGHTDYAIAAALGVAVKTVAKKRADLKRGMKKGAYDIPSELLQTQQEQGFLF